MNAQKNRVVIVGAGVAGVSAAGGVRAGGYEGEIVLLSDDTELPYRRPPLSKELLRGDKSLDEIRIRPADWYRDQGIELMSGAVVTEIDRDAQTVSTSGGDTVAYDRLVLATGGRARTFGPDSPLIHTVRSAADVPALAEALTAAESVTIVGGGLIGSEVASSAAALNCRATLLEAAGQPLPRLLPPALASTYESLHAENQTALETNVTVAQMVDDGAAITVVAEDGREWRSEVVVLAVGMQPNSELADAAGLEVDNGIVVDALGRTSDPNIYAAGDVANRPEPVLGGRIRTEHWQSSMSHGTTVGRNVAGDETEFDEVPWCWSDQYGTNLQVTGFPDAADDVIVRGDIDARDFMAFFLRDGQLVGAVGIGRPAEVRAARSHIGARGTADPAALADEGIPLADTFAATRPA